MPSASLVYGVETVCKSGGNHPKILSKCSDPGSVGPSKAAIRPSSSQLFAEAIEQRRCHVAAVEVVLPNDLAEEITAKIDRYIEAVPSAWVERPLKWQTAGVPMPHRAIPGLTEHGGTQLKTPRPVILSDSREQNPFDFARFQGWFAGIENKALKLGDYSIAGLEDVCVVERKDLPDLKSPYPYAGNPNRVSQSLIAVLAGLQVPFLCAETHELGEELIAWFTSIIGSKPTTTAGS